MLKPRARLLTGDCLERLRGIPDNTFATVLTDCPYGLSEEPDCAKVLDHWLNDQQYRHGKVGFMGSSWDSFVPGPLVWREVSRVLKPGGSALIFGGTRTVDLLTIALRLAGFSIRDQLMWLYGSGMPHGLDISKAVDRAAGVEREVVGRRPDADKLNKSVQTAPGGWKTGRREFNILAPATPEAIKWAGYNTRLKPAFEPIVWVMKPLEGNFVQNAAAHGVAGLNVDGCRIPTDWTTDPTRRGWQGGSFRSDSIVNFGSPEKPRVKQPNTQGRYPTNLLLDETAAEQLDQQAGETTSGKMRAGVPRTNQGGYSGPTSNHTNQETIGDQGGVSRFFYCAKVSRWERSIGLDKPHRHPTAKPVSLLRYLARLTATPGSSWVLDPFMGSGSTGVACMLEARNFCGIELDPEFVEIAKRRIQYTKQHPEQFSETEPNRQDRKPRPNTTKPQEPGLWGNRRPR